MRQSAASSSFCVPSCALALIFCTAVTGTVGGSPAHAIIMRDSIALVENSETWVDSFIIPSWSNGGAAMLPSGSGIVAKFRDHTRDPSLNRQLSVTSVQFTLIRCPG
jgi:hypothetical protein